MYQELQVAPKIKDHYYSRFFHCPLAGRSDAGRASTGCHHHHLPLSHMPSQLLSNKSEVLLIFCDVLFSNQGSTLVYADTIASEKRAAKAISRNKAVIKPQLLTGARRC